jgi:hypothetical protein
MADLLQAAIERSRVDFLRTNLDLWGTFVDLAKTEREIGDRAAAHRVLEKAETGYATVLRMSADVQNPDQKNDIEQRLADLRSKLDDERHCLNAPPA